MKKIERQEYPMTIPGWIFIQARSAQLVAPFFLFPRCFALPLPFCFAFLCLSPHEIDSSSFLFYFYFYFILFLYIYPFFPKGNFPFSLPFSFLYFLFSLPSLLLVLKFLLKIPSSSPWMETFGCNLCEPSLFPFVANPPMEIICVVPLKIKSPIFQNSGE